MSLMRSSRAILLGIERVRNLLADTLFRLQRRGSIVSVSVNLVADGFGRLWLDRIGERLDGTRSPGVMGQRRISLLIAEMVTGLVLAGKVGGDSGGT